MITRIIVYGILLILTIFTFYARLSRPAPGPEVQGQPPLQETVMQPQPVSSSEDRRVAEEPKEFPVISAPLPETGPARTAEEREKRQRYEKARELFRAGDYSAAAGLLRDLPESDPGVLTHLGISYFSLGDYSKAIACLEKAVGLNPRDFEARKALAFACYKADDLTKSLLHTEAALSLNNDPQLRTLQAKLKREERTQKDFVGESADHFNVLYDGHSHGGVSREVFSLLEDAYRHVGRELNHFPGEPVTVILYTDRDFFDTTQAPSWSGGFYDGKIRVPVRGLTGNTDKLKKVLFHEYTHAVVYSLTRRCPLWLNEGLAEYLSTTYPGKIGQAIPLKYLETSFRGLGSARDVTTAYRESWSAVSYLIERYGIYKVRELLLSLGNGADPDEAFRNCFGVSYDEFLSQWGRN